MTLSARLTGDLPKLFNRRHFAVEALLKGVPINVIFDRPYREIILNEGSVEGSSPECQVQSSDVTDVKQGDTLKIGTVTRKIIEIQPDGTGVTNLRLSKD